MPLYINTNTSSLNAQRQLLSSGQALDKAMTRLSSGMRINSAADDAAGLAISNRQTSQIRGLNQAVRNANDGISLIQTAEGAISESTNILQRMRELAVQSSNGIYDDKDRATMDAEVQQLVQELDRIAKSTSFNGKNILDGSLKKMDLQVGADANQTISMSIQAVDAKTLGMGSTSVDLLGAASSLATLTGADKLKENDILINGQSILKGTDTWDAVGDSGPPVVAPNTVQELVGHINKNVNGVTASTYAVASATGSGDGILTSAQKVTVELTNLDGTKTSIDVGGETTSLQELADKMNAASGGKFSVSIDEKGRTSISAENVASITVTDAAGALGAGITGATAAGVTLKADNGDPITVTRGSTGTLKQLDALGFRENDKIGVIEGHAVKADDADDAFVSGDLQINGVNVGASKSEGLQDKLNAINAISSETGVRATAFTGAVLDFRAVSLENDVAAGTFTLNGHELTFATGTATTTLSDIAKVFNDEADKTGVTATVSGTRLILEGNVAALNFGMDDGGATGVTDVFTNLEFGAGNDTLGPIADDTKIAGGIKLTSDNGSPISVKHKDDDARDKTGLLDSNATVGGAFGTAIANISISTQQGAQKALGVIDNALETVNDIRSQLGAVNNRLDFTVSNLSNVVENTQAARARITDADFAAETAALSRAQVLQQASQAMLAQANARPQQVLSLLQ